MTIEMAHLGITNNGATFLKVHFKETDLGGINHYETFYLTNKEGRNTYRDKDGKDRYIPGFAQANTLSLLCTGKYLYDLDFQKKTIKQYDYAAKEERNVQVDVAMDLLKKNVHLGLLKVIENKRVKDANGNWVSGNDKRELNTIGKIFAEDGRTLNEIQAKHPTGDYLKGWSDKHTGTVVDKYKPVRTAPAAPAPMPPPSTESLFD
jgi:hypothetical protein